LLDAGVGEGGLHCGEEAFFSKPSSWITSELRGDHLQHAAAQVPISVTAANALAGGRRQASW